MKDFEINACAAAEITGRMQTAGIAKAGVDFVIMRVLSVLAGSFNAAATLFAAFVVNSSTTRSVIMRLISGLVLCNGLPGCVFALRECRLTNKCHYKCWVRS
ncbi:MAG: hypothetical protein OEY87_09105 [Gammaproteobacteria bacterium]|nr:hypothetical protein [Gammaproteobacteria bacterium]MDH5736265.1 hypothetical protein [Gammaproteobacteria bacterium]